MKYLLGILSISSVLSLACGSSDKKETNPPTAPIKVEIVTKHTPAFNTSFENVLNTYYSLKDALVATNAADADQSATLLIQAADSLQLSEITFDSTDVIVPTAKDYLATMNQSATNLVKAKDIEAKRTQFEVISNVLYDLIRTVQYDNAKIYYEFCPMAFDNKGAYWLSKSPEIKNPYFGDKMLTCGEVKDSLGLK